MLHQKSLLAIAAAGLALGCGPMQGAHSSTQATEFDEPLAIFDLEIKRSRSTGEPEALSVRLENLADKPIWAYVLRITDESTGMNWDKVYMAFGGPAKEPGKVCLKEGIKPPEGKGINLGQKESHLSLSTEMVVFSDGSSWGGDSHPRRRWKLTQMLIGRSQERIGLQAVFKTRGVEALIEALMADASPRMLALEPVIEQRPKGK